MANRILSFNLDTVTEDDFPTTELLKKIKTVVKKKSDENEGKKT
jgi:hypothetical protein